MEQQRCVLVLFFLLLVSACRTGATDTNATEPAKAQESDKEALPGTPESNKTVGDGTGPYRTAQCRGLLEKYRARLAIATGSCEQTSDCGRHGGVDPDNVCGVATDSRTARALSSVRREMDDGGCMALAYSCPAQLPKCIDGTCAFEVH